MPAYRQYSGARRKPWSVERQARSTGSGDRSRLALGRRQRETWFDPGRDRGYRTVVPAAPRSKEARAHARSVFARHYAKSRDSRAAARAAGVSDRTGRRWRNELATPSAADRTVRAVPAEVTSFVGRDADLDRLDSLFADGSRLVTVVGSPGIGKTRLGQRFLARQDPGTAVAFCDVRDATSPEDLCVELSRSLGIQLADGQGQADLVSAVGQALAARGRCLVALDNFEQLVARAATCVSAWLHAAPELRLLITSRRVLRLEAEHVHELPPLALPQGEEDWSNASMQLFYERAVRVDPTLQRDAVTAAYTLPLVRRLEGIPLAIELAASQLRRLALGELLQRLETHVIELANNSRDVCQRHATLRRALGGSWQLLTPLERHILAQLTVFHGGFTSAAAEAVVDCGGERGTRLRSSIATCGRHADWETRGSRPTH